jgi:hypothetical protein
MNFPPNDKTSVGNGTRVPLECCLTQTHRFKRAQWTERSEVTDHTESPCLIHLPRAGLLSLLTLVQL